jgi:hypothetical protein
MEREREREREKEKEREMNEKRASRIGRGKIPWRKREEREQIHGD